MSDKELAVKGESAVEAFDSETLAGMEAASAKMKGTLDLTRDVRLPQLRLVQATSGDLDSAKVGQIFDSFASAGHDEVEVIPISTWKTRAYFGSGSIGDPPTCTSPDAIRGYGEIADVLIAEGTTIDGAGDCTRCPEADWRKGGRCQLRYNYLTMLLGDDADPENELPRGVMMHGTSAKVATRLNTMLLGSKYLWSSVLVLSSHSEKNDRGTYRVWDVRRARPTTQEEQLIAFRWYQTLESAQSVEIVDDEKRGAGNGATQVTKDEDIPF